MIEKYKKEITQLETQLQKVKHKHGILVEAARLLEEEELIPHRNLYQRIQDAERKRKQFRST